MAMPAEQQGHDTPRGGRIIGVEDWPRQRFTWLESLRRATGLTMTDKLVAHVLALDFANYNTLQCDPSYRQIAELVGVSEKSVQRAIAALVAGGWIGRRAGSGRGRRSAYVFLSRAQIVRLKVDKKDPQKVDRRDQVSGSERWTKKTAKVDKNAPAYNKAKPYKNHDAREGGEAPPSETLVRWAGLLREGDSSRSRYLTDIDIRKLLAFELVTKDQLRRCGIDVE